MEKLKIGKIVGTHGLKGELKIRSNSDFADKRFKKGNEIIISYQNQDLVYKIITSRIHKGNYLVSFRDNQDINLVEKYIGSFLYGYKDDELLDLSLIHIATWNHRNRRSKWLREIKYL